MCDSNAWVDQAGGGMGSVPILRMVRTPLQKGVVLRHVIKKTRTIPDAEHHMGK